jgi:hypothetical protein
LLHENNWYRNCNGCTDSTEMKGSFQAPSVRALVSTIV